MAIKVAVPKEISPGERRVAIDPTIADRLNKAGIEVLVQKGASANAQIPEAEYAAATIVADAKSLYQQADIVLKVQAPTVDEVDQMKERAVVVSFMMAHQHPEVVKKFVEKKITSFGIELLPRITRAQSMDALSSQGSVAGYKAAIMGGDLSNRFFPMLTTAAGTIRPAKVLVIGAGVAGLQAIATARRLGARVDAYDVRAETKEQVESLGAKFLQIDVQAEGEGGYARELTEEEKQRQQEMLAKYIGMADVLITTAAVPGKPSPKIISKSMVEGMNPGAVIIDLAAEGGGNCELTKPGKTAKHKGVVIHAPLNVPSQVAFHASEMYAKNLFNFIQLMIQDGKWTPNWDDEITAGSVVTHEGEIKHAPTRELVGGRQHD